MAEHIVTTTSGKVQGVFEQGLFQFKGIPYAKAKRFEAPYKTSWDGILNCSNFGKKAFQNGEPSAFANQIDICEMSENCQFLNVFTPSTTDSLPVLVEFHGGSFQTGSGEDVDGVKIVGQNKFVYVSFNYRLGVFGFLSLADVTSDEKYKSSGNCGTLDQLALLKWVKENIAFFGGDPNRITALGSSAGAKSIATLMTIPKSDELFSKAILSSGGTQAIRTVTTAKNVSNRFFEILGEKDLEHILNLQPQQLINAQRKLCVGGSTCLFGAVEDDVVVSKEWFARQNSQDFWKGSAIVGSSKNELVFYKRKANFLEIAPKLADELFGDNSKIAKSQFENFLHCNSCATEEEKKNFWVKIFSDNMYRTYSNRLAKSLLSNGSKVWQFSFEFPPAFHIMDHLLAFNDFASISQSLNENQEIKNLSGTIKKAYINFVISDNPNCDEIPLWESQKSNERKQIVWDIPCRIENTLDSAFLDGFPECVFALMEE